MSLIDQIEADSSTFFSRDDFAIDLTWSGGVGPCLFDREYVEVGDELNTSSTFQPVARVHLADFPGIATDDPVTVKGITYTVRDIQPDLGETGDALLILST